MEIINVIIYMIHWNSLDQLINCLQGVKLIKLSLNVVIITSKLNWETPHECLVTTYDS